MHYLSTRGRCEPLTFRETVLTGLAPDGGLFLPESVPQVAKFFPEWRKLAYPDLCAAVMSPFVGEDLPEPIRSELIRRACEAFDTPEVTPVVPLGPIHLVELFHGPTLAFKDVALQFLGLLFEHYLQEGGRRMTVVGATSGDTGSAAIHALKGKANVEVFILYPQGRVSPMQERQMTTVPEANIHTVAVEGSFDDAQAIVKGMFADAAFNGEFVLGAVNSINWARVMAQIIYFFYAYFRLTLPGKGRGPVISLGEAVRFAVPTGNFGHIFAGHLARRMGLPIERLILATNANDILHRFIRGGVYSRGQLMRTLSPSMDIQVASNFERYLFELAGYDGATLVNWLETFEQTGTLELGKETMDQVSRDFLSVAVDDDQTRETIGRIHREQGFLLDPHSAIGVCAALAHADDGVPVISMATAHPAKFGDAIEAATGAPPPLPEALARLASLATRGVTLPARRDAVQDYIRESLAS